MSALIEALPVWAEIGIVAGFTALIVWGLAGIGTS